MVFEGKALIVVDELAVFLEHITTANGPGAAENLMNWLRNIRQSHQGRIVWVYCSSVSITNFVKRHNMSYTINDISSFPLGEMAYEEASHLLKELCSGQGIEVFADDDMMRELLQPLTNYYRMLIANLSVLQRRTVICLLSSDSPLLLKDIRSATNLAGGDLSPQLKSLSFRGLITQVGSKTLPNLSVKSRQSCLLKCL